MGTSEHRDLSWLILQIPSPVRRILQLLRQRWKAFRFRLWAQRLKLDMRRNGGRLILEADEVPEYEELPRPRIVMQGEGDGTFRLRIGNGVHFGRGVTIEVWAPGSNSLEIGDHCLLHGCSLQVRSGSISLADHVQVRDFAIVKSYGEMRIGSRSFVSYSCVVHCEELVELGEQVGLAERVTVIDTDKELRRGSDWFNDRARRVGPVSIGRNTFVAAGAVISRGARIGAESAVAANAVVRAGDFPEGWLLGGVPAEQIRPLPETG